MTDGLGRRARWTAALVVAPGAAALFGVSVSWADHARPAAAPAPAPRAVSGASVVADTTTASADRASAALRRTLGERQQEAALLTKRLAALRHQLAVDAAAAATARTSSAGSSSGGGSTGQNSGTGTGAYVAPAPAAGPAAQPAPAPVAAPAPPAVQVTTRASGAPP